MPVTQPCHDIVCDAVSVPSEPKYTATLGSLPRSASGTASVISSLPAEPCQPLGLEPRAYRDARHTHDANFHCTILRMCHRPPLVPR
jgi:hypothetical protein